MTLMFAWLKNLWDKWFPGKPELAAPDGSMPVPLFSVRRALDWVRTQHRHKQREPYCQWCGRLDYLECHHVLPFELRPDLELDDGIDGTGTDGNLITLCRPPGRLKLSCHYMQGHRGTSWRHYDPDIRRKCEARRLGLS